MHTEKVDGSALFAEPPSPNPDAISAARSVDAPVARTDPAPVLSFADEPAATEPQTDAPATDDAGTPFDASKHLPTKHPRTGRWMPRRKPKANGSEPPPTDTGSVIGADDEPTPEPTGSTDPTGAPTGPDVYAVMADLHCRAFYGIAVAVVSDEWLPEKAEHRANIETLAAYYRATGMKPDSPGWALLAQGVAFAGKRLAMEKTQTRLGMLKAWFVTKFAGWRGARRATALQNVGT